MSYPAIHAAPSVEIAESTVDRINLLVDAIEELYPPDSQYSEVRLVAYSLILETGIGVSCTNGDLQIWRVLWSLEQLQTYYEACIQRSEQE